MKITKILKEFVIMKSLFLLTGEADLSDRYELFIIQNIYDIYIYMDQSKKYQSGLEKK